MDITPQVINEVEFPLKVRGYDADEVDDFLERVAVGVGQLHERLEQLTERATTAERRAAELEKRLREGGGAGAQGGAGGAGGASAAQPSMSAAQETEQLSRTLAMAQRFVDQAMKEAQEEADKLVADATERSRRMHTEADVEIERLRNEAQADIADEVRRLEEARASLQGDVEALTRHADDQRSRLRTSLAEFERLLDDPEGLRTTAGPEVSGASLPDFARQRGSGSTSPPGPASATDSGSGDRPAAGGPMVEPDIEPEAAVGDQEDEAGPGPVSEALEPERPVVAPVAAVRGDEPENDDDAWAKFAQGPEPMNEGPPTAVHLGPGGGDPYLSELRQAMGQEPAPTPDTGGATVVPFDQDDDPTRRRRFERR
jgi:DivIVA domain-containing protein